MGSTLDASQLRRLQLDQLVDCLILGRSSVEFKGPFTDGLFNSRMSVEIHVIATKTGTIAEQVSIAADGLGFSKDKAGAAALEELTKKVAGKRFDLPK